MLIIATRLTRQLLNRKNILANLSAVMASSASNGKLDLTVSHNTEEHQFFIDLEPPNRAILDYEVMEKDTVDLYHTGVPTSYRGHGIAAELAKAAFGHFTERETKMMLTCTYLQKYYKEHPDSIREDLVKLPGQA